MDILIAVFFTLVGVNLTVLVSAVVMLLRPSQERYRSSRVFKKPYREDLSPGSSLNFYNYRARVLAERGGYRGGRSAKDMPPPTKVPSARIRIEYFNDSKDNLDGPLD